MRQPGTTITYSALLTAGMTLGTHASEAMPSAGIEPPIAYVRTLAMPPVRIAAQPDTPLPPKPPTTEKQKTKVWLQVARAHEQQQVIRKLASQTISDLITVRLGRISGLRVIHYTDAGVPARGEITADVPEPGPPEAELRVAIEKLGFETGLERMVWIQANAELIRKDGRSSPPSFYTYGQARAGASLFGSRFQKTNQDLMLSAADALARQVLHYLMTGEEPLFARPSKVAILPALLPEQDEKSSNDGQTSVSVPLPALARQRDVLLQPELTRVVQEIDKDLVVTAMLISDVQPRDLWKKDGKPDLEIAKELGKQLDAAYVFVSRVVDIDLSEGPVTVSDSGQPREGLVRHATADVEAFLLRVEDGKVMWTDRREAVTTSQTEYIRHKPRIRTEEQCYLDATRTAYAYLRFSLEEYKRKFER